MKESEGEREGKGKNFTDKKDKQVVEVVYETFYLTGKQGRPGDKVLYEFNSCLSASPDIQGD